MCKGLWGKVSEVKDRRCCLLIGNSRWHWAIKEADGWHFVHTTPEPHKASAIDLPLVAWAAVGPIPKNLVLEKKKRVSIEDIPLKKLPPWLGIDRALAGWEAFKRAKSAAINSCGVLVADAGTVLSLTRITSDGEFAGGQLVAGLNLQLSAMEKGAKNLSNPGPGSSKNPQFPITTAEAMQRGSLQALVGTLIEAVNETNMQLWLCGGDAPVLIEELRKRNKEVLHHPNLVLEGMVDIQQRINPGQDL